MANLTEITQFDTSVYQIETTDPVLGGANGIANVQAKQLANRTQYLKVRTDQVDAAASGFGTLDARLDLMQADISGTDIDMFNALVASDIKSEADAGLALREIEKIKTKNFQTGTVTIRNTGLISGCNVTASTTQRSVSISAGTIYLNGVLVPISEQINTTTIAQNTTASVGYVKLYIDSTGDVKATQLNFAIPSNTVELYSVTVPAGNTADDGLAACTFTKTITVQADYPNSVSVLPKSTVTLPYNVNNTNYMVELELGTYSGASYQFGSINVTNKTTTGFDITLNGTVDNVVVKWMMSKLDL
jgi:hypothetical protein